MIQMKRVLFLPEGDLAGLPPVAEVDCLRTDEPVVVDGRLEEPVWQRAWRSSPFVKMDTGAKVCMESRISLLWNDVHLYVAFRFEDHEIWGSHVEHHDHVYHRDSDAEIFIDGNGCYYELGVNPINTVYEVLWTWIEPVVARQDVLVLNRLFAAERGLYLLPRRDECLGRFGETDWQLPGLRHAVSIEGSLNNPAVEDTGWTVELALPWSGLAALGHEHCPPRSGDVWRIGASRCQHFRSTPATMDGLRTGDLPHPRTTTSEDWSWNQHGSVNMHVPERWSRVRFVDVPA